MSLDKLTMSLEINTDETIKELDDLVERAKAIRSFLVAAQKTPIGILKELISEILSFIPDEEGKFDFIWKELSQEEREEIEDLKEKARFVLSNMGGE